MALLPLLPFLALLLLLSSSTPTLAQIFTAHPRSCLDPTSSSSAPIDERLLFTRVYAQFDQGQLEPGQKANGFDYATGPDLHNTDGTLLNGTGSVLRIVLTGMTNSSSQGYSNATGFLSTVDLNTQILTFPINTNQSALCSSIRTAGNTVTGITTNGTNTVTESGCPYGPGQIALGLSVPLESSYELTTITAQLVVLDPSTPPLRLACYNLDFTPYYPTYFVYPLIRYLIIGLLLALLVTYFLARLYASHSDWIHEHQTHLATSLTLKISAINDSHHLPKRQVWGTVWYGAWAGRQLIGSGSLRRFLTAELREVWQTVMWWSLIGTVAVNWPGFAYPVFQKTAWTALIYNNTLPFTHHSAPLLPQNFSAPTSFATEMNDITSPLYLDPTLPNVLLDLESSSPGILKWARIIGIKASSLFSISAFTFFAICAGVVGVHAICWAVDSTLDRVMPAKSTPPVVTNGNGTTRTSPVRNGLSFGTVGTGTGTGTGTKRGKESFGSSTRPSDGSMPRPDLDDFGRDDYDEDAIADRTIVTPRPEDDYPNWQLHLALLQGNLVRVLVFFHLPLTLFSIFQITLHATCPTSTLVLAILTLVVVCAAIPLYLLYQIHHYDIIDLHYKLPVLLSLGPLYNTYSEECCMFSGVRFASNILVGALIGGAQSVGTAQAAVILLVEVADTLVTSLWLPWGDNAAMGPLAFILSISRIIMAVLLVVLSPQVAVSDSAAAWLAYIVFLVQGLVLLLLFFVLIFKVIELVVRFVGNVPFDENRSSRVGGLFGALRRWDRGGRRKKSGGGGGGAGSGQSRSTAAVRRREAQERKRREQGTGSEGTVDTRTRMLHDNGQPNGRQPRPSRESSALTMSSYGDGLYRSTTGQGQPNSFGEDDGYIMSAMSSGPWASTSAPPGAGGIPGYVKPGTYSSAPQQQQPVLRSTNWAEPTIVSPSIPTVQSSSAVGGFTRVGGGRASSSNPYQLANSSNYPSSSADLYSHQAMPENPRRLSQSAVIEMAAASGSSPDNNLARHGRPSLALPQSSRLLSNTTPYPPRSPIRQLPPKPAGFFGRFKKSRRANSGDFSSEDDFSDDSDEEEARRPAPKKSMWPMKVLFGGKQPDKEMEEQPEEEDTGERGFSVTRRPRPQPGGHSPQPQTQTPTPNEEYDDAPLEELHPGAMGSAPHLSIEPPSRPTSLLENER